jgi:hypothetical protein
MADRELIAAILTAGMLPTLEIPQSRTRSRHGPLARAEADTIQHAVDHAFGVYRLVLNRLGVDPLAFEAEPTADPGAPASPARDEIASQFGRDACAKHVSEVDNLEEAHAPAG